MKNFLIRSWPILIIFILALPALTPFLKTGLFPSHDAPVYVLRSQQFFKALVDGQLPPRWAQDFNFRFGYPIFNFFYPLSYFLASFFHFFGFSFTTGVKFLFLISFLGSGITMYFFTKEFFGKFGGIISALLYLYSPFHAVNLYVRGSLGELLVMMFLPLLLLSVYKRRFLSAGILLALIILSHNILAMMSFGLLLIYNILIYYIKEISPKRYFYGFLLTIFLGLGLSSFFWLPAILEKGYTIFDQVALQEFNFRDHFVYPLQLRYSPWGFGGSIPGPIDGMSFKLGKIPVLFSLAGFLGVFLTKKKELKKFVLFFGLVFAVATFLSLNLSYFLWEYLPLLELVQFPWRFLNLTMFGMAFLAGGMTLFLEKYFTKQWFLIGVFVISLVIVIFNVGFFKAGPEPYKTDQEFLAEEEIIEGNSTYVDELLPVWVKEMPGALPISKIEIEGEGEISEEEFQSNLIKAKITLEEKAQVKINNFYFPGWQIFINRKRKDFEILEPLGNIGLVLEKGEHLLELKLLSTSIQKLANFISLLSLIALLSLKCKKKLKF